MTLGLAVDEDGSRGDGEHRAAHKASIMIDVYGLDEAAGRWRQAASTLATEFLAPHAAEVDALGDFPWKP
jgi:hypothetical protein